MWLSGKESTYECRKYKRCRFDPWVWKISWDLPNPGIEPGSPALQADALPSELPGKPWFNYWGRKIHCRRDRLPTPVFLGFHCGSVGKESVCNEGDLDSIPGLTKPPGEEKGYPLQYSGQGNSVDYIVHGITKSWT